MNIPTVVSFDAGNICHCINSIRYINPKIKIMIAVITEEGVKEIINIQNAKDELYEVVKEFYGDLYRDW